MYIEIIPTILVKSFDEVKERIKAVEKYVGWIHLDIMDGIFVNNETWPAFAKATAGKLSYKKELAKLKKLKMKVKLEAHLMVQEPEKVIDDWLKFVDRIIVHFESKITNRELGIRELIKKVHSKNKEIGFALNPETHPMVITPFLRDLDLVLFMSIQPGWGGQEFKSWVLDKVKVLRDMWPDGNIEIDGGMNPETAKKAIESGVNLICAGTYIFNNKNIIKAINELKLCITSSTKKN